MAAAEVGHKNSKMKPSITINPPLEDSDPPPQPGRQRTQTPSVSGAEHSDTEENYVDEQVINRDKNYRTSIVAADLKHDDPIFAISIDRYGFPTEQEESEADEAARRKRQRKENDRLVKWQQMLFQNKNGQMHTLTTVNMLEQQISQWNLTKNHKKLKSRIRKGIPHQFRGTMWQNLAGARELQYREQKKYGKKSLYNDYVRKNKSPFHDQLWKDINRTYRKQVRFGMVGVKLDEKESESNLVKQKSKSKSKSKSKDKTDEKSSDKNDKTLQLGTLNRGHQDTSTIQTPQDLEKNPTDAQMQLYNVLKAFSLYREDVGYCQGMQSVSALMLMMMTEEETFWMLASLADDVKFRMELLWRPDMPAITLRFFQMERLVMIILPKLAAHFKKNHIDSASMYQATQWFVTVFLATNMQFDTVLRVWDIYLNEGLKTIFRMGIGFLKYFEKDLLSSSFEEMHEIFRDGQARLDTEKYIETCFSFKITHAQLSALERQFNEQEQQMMAQMNGGGGGKGKKKGKKGKGK